MNRQLMGKQIEKTENSELLLDRTHGKTKQEEKDSRRPYQHDRDRIIHSRAFRRLMHKTQIFNANKGDHYRNRLTHTLEVMQIARSIGRLLNLNEDLIEAIALGHDLGHTPFGHIGERTLNSILSEGIEGNIPAIDEEFKHNFQSVRVVEHIESRTDYYNGLNLTFAVREGIIKHTKTFLKDKYQNPHTVKYNKRILDTDCYRLDLPNSITLEGQVVAIADEIAQITHDVEDGMRGKIISFNDVISSELFKTYLESCGESGKKFDSYNQKNQVIKGCIGFLIDDVVDASTKKIDKYKEENGEPDFSSLYDVYEENCIDFSKEIKKKAIQLGDLRTGWIINSKEIAQSDSKAEYFIRQIFKAYYKHPKELPDYILARYYEIGMEKLVE